MRITINSLDQYIETEIVINCGPQYEKLPQLVAAIKNIENDKEDGHERIPSRKDGIDYALNAKKIVYTDTNERRSFIYTIDECYESGLKLYELEEKLKDIDFMRVNKSCIINFEYIKKIESDLDRKLLLTMKNNMRVVVSRLYSGDFRKRLEENHE
jgi:DNA-binding LytR/AlgR family response regulator